MQTTASKLADLKAALRAASGAAHLPADGAAGFPTGWSEVDALLGGGLPRGRVVEVAGAWSSGKGAFALAAAAKVTAKGRRVAWIDARGELYPPSAAWLGVDLERLLIVRPGRRGPAVAHAAEIVARSRAFPLVVVDLPDGETLTDAAATRVRNAAHAARAAVVVLASTRGSVVHAAITLSVAARTEGGARFAAVTVGKGGARPPGTVAEVALGAPLASFPSTEARQALGALELPPPRRPSLRKEGR